MPATQRLLTPAFALLTGTTFVYFLGISVVIPTLPRYVERVLSGGSVAVGVAVGALSVTAVAVRPFAGRLGDRRGRRAIMVGGAALVGLATSGYLVAWSLPLLVGFRLLQGAGEALYFVGAATVVADLAPAHRRAEAVSYFSTAVYSGLAVGPTLGEAIAGRYGYGAVWLLALGFGVAASLLATRMPETRPEGTGDRVTRLVHPAGVLPGIVLGLAIVGLAGFSAFLPLYSPTIGIPRSGPVFAVYAGIVLVIRVFGARLPDRLGTLRSSGIALASGAAGLALMGLWRTVPGLLAGTVLFSVGIAMNFPALVSLAVSMADEKERGAVMGTFTAFFDAGFAIGPIALGGVVALTNHSGAFIGGAIANALGLVLLLVAFRSPRPVSPVAHPDPALE